MPDVPNLSILTPKKEKPVEEIAPRHRLGHLVRSRRNVMKKSLNEATKEIATALGDPGFTNVVLGEIERGVRPATMEQLEAISRVLDVGLDLLRQHAIEWHESIWDGKPRYELRPGETGAATIHTMDVAALTQELRGAMADLDRAADGLALASTAMKASDPAMSMEAGLTAEMIRTSARRIAMKLDPDRAKATFAPGYDVGGDGT